MTPTLLAASALALGTLLPLSAAAAGAAPATCCQVVELRQYITYPGQRDVLIDLFEREFVESQETLGIRVLGQFRDLNDPTRYTWLRGFPSMAARQQALTDFYGGTVWRQWREQANATLYDNDDVLLLRPAEAGSGFKVDVAARAAVGAHGSQAGLVVATIYHFKQEASAEFIATFGKTLAPIFEKNGATLLGRFVSEKSANTFPRLPVREDANVFVWFAHFKDRAAFARYNENLGRDGQWGAQFAPLYKRLARTPEVLLLEPSARSLLR
jgi:hypothetical protein